MDAIGLQLLFIQRTNWYNPFYVSDECFRITPQIKEIIKNISESSSSSEVSIPTHSCQIVMFSKQTVDTENQALSATTKKITQSLCNYTSGKTSEESMICSYCSKNLESKQRVEFNCQTSYELSEYSVQIEIQKKSQVSLERANISEFCSMNMGNQTKNHKTQSESITHPNKLQRLQKNQRKDQSKFEKVSFKHSAMYNIVLYTTTVDFSYHVCIFFCRRRCDVAWLKIYYNVQNITYRKYCIIKVLSGTVIVIGRRDPFYYFKKTRSHSI